MTSKIAPKAETSESSTDSTYGLNRATVRAESGLTWEVEAEGNGIKITFPTGHRLNVSGVLVDDVEGRFIEIFVRPL